MGGAPEVAGQRSSGALSGLCSVSPGMVWGSGAGHQGGQQPPQASLPVATRTLAELPAPASSGELLLPRVWVWASQDTLT